MRFRQFFGLVIVLLGVTSFILSACGSSEPTSGTDKANSNAAPTAAASGALPPGAASLPQTEFLPPYGCLPAITITDVVVQACMDNPEPDQRANLQVTTRMSKNGVAIQKAPVKTTWDYQTGPKDCLTTSDKDGVGFCYQNIGEAAPGFRVVVEVQYEYNGKAYKGETSFTPKGNATATSASTNAPATATKSAASVKASLFPQQPIDPKPEDLSKQGNLTYQTAKCLIKGNIAMETGEKIYLMPDDRYYITTKIDPEFGERWFCTEQDAIKNGWRKTQL